MSSLTGKTVVVIGGSRGVGRQIVETERLGASGTRKRNAPTHYENFAFVNGFCCDISGLIQCGNPIVSPKDRCEIWKTRDGQRGINLARLDPYQRSSTMTESPTRESLPQPNEQSQPRQPRNIYDYDGEYEFPTVQHWTAPNVPAPAA